jgi:ubiquinone/menaquinone biosynthesis C-methylase UbiE
LPQDAKVAVVSHGDDELLNLNGCVGWHFPQTSEGIYAGHHPKDSDDAIAQLEQLRSAGADFLLLPSTSSWWLNHYDAFKQHLEVNYCEIAREERACVIFDLRAKAKPQNESSVGVIVAQDFHPHPDDPKLIAFYLPQFHSIPENDAWWGEGFTEWTNVGKAKPLFPGHHQPRLPSDLGFYDLRLADTRAAQADLARTYGIHGFCYYHYWFSGKQLLARPFNEVLSSHVPDFPFCLCWANEPWSRRWNGRAEDVLQPQEYSPEDDLNHIRWLLPALKDQRAIQIEGKPVFVVYQGRDLPEPARTIETWRREVSRAGLPGIYLLTVETGWDTGWDATTAGFDGKILFAPQFTTLFNSGAEIPVPGKDNLRVFDYQKAWPVLANPAPVGYHRFETVCPGWDNAARRGDQAVVMHNSTPDAYGRWLREASERARALPPKSRVVFINAWNEWAEGAHLEPDLKNGRAYLEATRRALIEARVASIGALRQEQAVEPVKGGNGVTTHHPEPPGSAPAAATADPRGKWLHDLAAQTKRVNVSPHELVETLPDEDWFWLNTEGCRRSEELRRLLPSLPDSETQARIIGNSGDIALREGFDAYKLVKQLFGNHEGSRLRNLRILDFGCGWGRIIRFFLKEVPPRQLTGIDCSAQLIDICKATNPWCEFAVNPVDPPTTLPSTTYDLIYLYSVFTHLSEDSQRAWLAEFHRLLKPGGLLIATTWHREFITWCQSLREDPSLACEPGWRRTLADVFRDTEQQLARYDAGLFVFAPYEPRTHAWAYTGGIPRYGEACVSHNYVLKNWTDRFEFVEFLQDRAKCPQNVIVVRKPKTASGSLGRDTKSN